MSKILYKQTALPIFQNKVYSEKEKALNTVLGDIRLVQCSNTGLVYNHLFDSKKLQYDEDYQNEQAYSPVFISHLNEVKDLIRGYLYSLGKGIEIGCGKGYFLEMLCKEGADVTGFDPAFEGNNPRVRKEYFNGNLDGDMPDYIILRHVLEHIADPFDFLRSLSKTKNGCGIYIEVPCFDWIVENSAFYDIFYEHCNYFTLELLENSFESIWSSGHFFGGQYCYFIADLSTFHFPSADKIKKYSPLEMNYTFDYLISKLNRNCRTYIWGAGAKGVTFSNILYNHKIHVDGVIDINPNKQNKYIGLSGIKVYSPEDVRHKFQDANVFIMNPVYLEEIMKILSIFTPNIIQVV